MKQWLAAVTVVVMQGILVACGTTSDTMVGDAANGQAEAATAAARKADARESDSANTAATLIDESDDGKLQVVIVDNIEPFTVEVLARTAARLRIGPGTQYDRIGLLPRDKTSFASHRTPGGWILLTKDDRPYAYVWHKLVSVISVYE